jgi:hypothetical protein
MSRKPSLFNEALAGFFRSTETTARNRAEAADRTETPAATEPNPLAGGPPADDTSDRDWLTAPNADPTARSPR